MKNNAHEMALIETTVIEAVLVELSEMELVLVGGGTGEVVIA